MADETINCPRCETEIGKTEKNCPKCGFDLETFDEETLSKMESALDVVEKRRKKKQIPPPQPEPEPEPKKKKGFFDSLRTK